MSGDATTQRWGDQLTASVTSSGGILPVSWSTNTKQLIAAHWRWPLMWGLRISIVPALDATETATFTITITCTVGSGQTAIPVVFTYVLAPVAGVYAPINDLQQIPAEDVQVIATVTGQPAAAAGVKDNIVVGAVIAPFTDPHGLTRLYDWMMTPPNEQPEGGRWMDGRPFADQRLTYR